MSSFNLAALILSYLDYQDTIEDLLYKLSHNARLYYKAHLDILENFLCKWNPEVVAELDFGDEEDEFNKEFNPVVDNLELIKHGHIFIRLH